MKKTINIQGLLAIESQYTLKNLILKIALGNLRKKVEV
jgi:hypothetical protein